MDSTVCCLVLATLLGCVSAQYYDRGYDKSYNGGYDNRNYEHNAPYNGPKVAILNHKQALGPDGSFNFAFNAENGIHQGESINPDGSRQGSYSYVDPSGKTVSLKYVAGRDGFKVLEGDHIPRAVPLPAQHAAAYQAAAAAHAEAAHRPSAPYSAPYRQGYNGDDNDDHGSYQQNYRSNDDGAYRSGPGDDGSYRSGPEEVHTGPHSFGNGFAFEFGGSKY